MYDADGIRLMVSVAGEGRRMEFRVGSQAEDGKVVLTTEATAVAMDGVAAGSGGAGSVLYDRFGNGVTLSLDLAVVLERGRTGPGLRKADKKLNLLFHGAGDGRGVGKAGRACGSRPRPKTPCTPRRTSKGPRCPTRTRCPGAARSRRSGPRRGPEVQGRCAGVGGRLVCFVRC